MEHEIRQRLRAMYDRGRGTSKHEDKEQNGGKPAADKIYSFSTLDNYRGALLRFSKASAVEGKCHNMAQARRYAPVWLQARIDSGLSAWTVRAEAAALAKFYGCATTELGVSLPSRHQSNVKQHRRQETWEKRFSEDNNRDLVDFCKASGLRDNELANLAPGSVTLNEDGSRAIVEVEPRGAKGGKRRQVVCLDTRPYEIAQAAAAAGRALVFPHVPAAAPIHYYRAMYAQELYKRIARQDVASLPTKQQYRCRGAYKGRCFDRQAVGVVTRAIGHARLGVTVLSYLVSYGED